MRISKSVATAFLVVCSFSLFLNSPAARSQVKMPRVPKGDAYFGFSRTGNDMFYPNVGGLNGWEGAFFLKVHKPFLGVEADVSHYGLGANIAVPRTTAVMGGPRVAVKIPLGPKLFAHALGGLEHSANPGGPTPISADALVYALGGGGLHEGAIAFAFGFDAGAV